MEENLLEEKLLEERLIELQTLWPKTFLHVHKILRNYELLSYDEKLFERTGRVIKDLNAIFKIIRKVQQVQPNIPRDINLTYTIIYMHLGILHSKKQDIVGIEYFRGCIKFLQESDRSLEPERILAAICSHNEAGRIYFNLKWYEESKKYLEKAERMYNFYTKNIKQDPLSMSSTAGVNIEGDLSGKDFLKKLHMLTLRYLIDVYNSLNDEENAIHRCYMFIKKGYSLLKINKLLKLININWVNWIDTIMTVVKYYTRKNDFLRVKYYLFVATDVTERYRQEVIMMKSDIAEYEAYRHVCAEIARSCIYYGLAVMKISQSEKLSQNCPDEVLEFYIEDPELDKISNEITNATTEIYISRKTVFEEIIKWSDKAKKYYTPDNHPSAFANIEFTLAEACRKLTYSDNANSKYVKNILTKRIDVLEDFVAKLIPLEDKELYQKVQLELGNLYRDFLRTVEKENGETRQVEERKKDINNLATKGVNHYRLFLKYVKLEESQDDQTALILRVIDAMYASYFLGELYLYLSFSTVKNHIQRTQNRIKAYQFVLSCHDKYLINNKTIQPLSNKIQDLVLKSNEFVNEISLGLFQLRQSND